MARSERGFEDEARQRMIDAARRSGVSVGELVQALVEPTRPGARSLRADDRAAGRPLDDLADRLRRLSEPTDTAERLPRSRRAEADRASTLDEVSAAVDRLSRMDTQRRRPVERRDDETSRILDALEGLDRRVRALTDDQPIRRDFGEPVPARARREVDPPVRSRPELEAPRVAATEATRLAGRAPVREAAIGDDLDRRFRELGEKIDLLRPRDERDGTHQLIAEIRAMRSLVEARGETSAELGEEIRRLAGRVDDLIGRTPDREVVEPLVTEIGRLRDVVLQSDVEGSLRSLEAGYGHIVDRLDELKRGLGSTRGKGEMDRQFGEIRELLGSVPQVAQISLLEQRLEELGGKLETLANRRDTGPTEVLERRMADLRKQIEAVDPTKVVKALDQRLKVVAEKLDGIERSTRGPVSDERVIALLDELKTLAAGNRTADEIRILDARLVELGDRIADLDRRWPTAVAGDGLHDRLAELAGKLDRLVQPRDDRPTVAALERAIERFDAFMDRAPDAERVALIDRDERATREVEGLTREIAAMREDLARARPNDALEAQMRLLAERLDRSVARDDDDDETLAQIEEQLVGISRQLALTETRFADIAAIEGHIRRLTDRIEYQREDAIAAARDAAREMVRELADLRGDDGASETALRALQDDLRSLQSAARDTETRTNGTLVSLHDALTGIVGRLAAIEKIAQGSARSAAAARSAAQAAETAAQTIVQAPAAPSGPTPAAAGFVPAPMSAAAQAAAAVAQAAARLDRGRGERTIDVTAQPTIAGRPVEPGTVAPRAATPQIPDEDTRPLEPGSGKPSAPRGEAMPTAAAPMPTPAPATPAAAPTDPARAATRKADFIAAARRAAQAAAASTGDSDDLARGRAAGDAAATPSAEPTEANGALARIGRALKANRRPLVLAAAAVVLAILTFQVMPGREPPPRQTVSDSGEPKETTASITSPTPAAETPSPMIAPSAPSIAPSAPSISPPPPAAAPAQSSAVITVPAIDAAAPAAIASLVPSVPMPASPPPSPPQRVGQAMPADETTTTGSIPAGAATAPAGAVDPNAVMPERIGSEALRRAALAGDAKAVFEVGLRFAEGRGVTADPARAVAWYGKAADKGLAQAQYRLAVALDKAQGTARDSERAKALYTAAALQGNVRSMHNLGVMFAGARDMTQAVTWFQKAADLGLKDSQFNLGVIYALGSGVKQDLAVSYKWFALAARQGDQDAEKKLTEVGGHLDKVSLAAAKMAASTWVQRALDPASNDESRVWSEPAATAAAAAADAKPAQPASPTKKRH